MAEIKTVLPELPKPWGYARNVDGRIQISVGPDCPPCNERGSGYFTPWAAMYGGDMMIAYAEAAVLSALTPPTWRCCEKMVEQGAGNMVCCGEPIEVAVLSANAGKVDDTARIDWLESEINKHGAIHLHDGQNPAGYGLGLRPGYANRSLRQAIDMAAPSPNAAGY